MRIGRTHRQQCHMEDITEHLRLNNLTRCHPVLSRYYYIFASKEM